MDWRAFLKSFDYVLALAVIGLGAFGIIMIYTATNAPAIFPSVVNSDGGLWRDQRMFVISGTFLMLGFAFIDYRFISRFYIYIYIVMIFLLVAVLIVGGDDGTGTARWFRIYIPFFRTIGIQPSEFAKVFIVIFLAKLLDVKKDRFNHIFWLVPIFASIGVTLFLVMQQNALSATLVILFISGVVVFTAGLYYRTIAISLVLILPLLLIVWFDIQRSEPLFVTRILDDYQWSRIETFFSAEPDPDRIHQVQGSLYAIATGGLFGKGFMNNTHVIVGHNDFIFSVVAEQFGFVGAAAVLGVMALIIIKCILIALKADDLKGRLIAAGVAGMLIFEVFVNVGVATDLLPTTGMAFPFLSYGGSIMWVHMMAIGMVLNIGLPREKSMFEKED
jgi:rod shape determining protein RodA